MATLVPDSELVTVLESPEKHWWKRGFHQEEKVWISLAFTWVIFMWFMNPYLHLFGPVSQSNEYYQLSISNYESIYDRFVEKYKVGDDDASGNPIVEPPPGDIFFRAVTFDWSPVMRLKAGKTYRLHHSSLDMMHGFSLQPINLNFQIIPGYTYVNHITPQTPGEYVILCNEFCGDGHHAMSGKIIVY